MEFKELFAKAKAGLEQADAGVIGGNLAFQFDLSGENGGTFYVDVRDGVISVEPYEFHDRDVRFMLSTEDFGKMMEGKLNSVMAFTTGRLKIDGDIGKALEFKKLLGGGDE